MSLTGILSTKQEQSIAWSTARINVWEGAIRSGKTLSSLLRWMMYVAKAPPGELIMAGRSVWSLSRNIFTQLQDPTIMGPAAEHVVYTPGAVTARILGRRVHVIGATDVRAEAKIRGITCAGAYVDEATIMPESFWVQLLGRMSVPGSKVFATTNADNASHWLKTGYIDNRDLDIKAFHFTLDDNPSLTQEYLTAIKAEFTGLWHRRFILGEWCAAEGAVYDMWDPAIHVVDDLPFMRNMLAVGVDYGTTNPFAAVLIALGGNNCLYVISEMRWDARRQHRQLTDVELSQRFRDWLNGLVVPGTRLIGITPERIFVDPSAASFKVQLFRDHFTAHDANNNVGDGIRSVASLLGARKLRVHSSCKGLITEISGYSWDDAAALKGVDKPIKVADHSVDALRYAVHSTRSAWRAALLPAAEKAEVW